MGDPENKLMGGKNTRFVFGFRKILRKKNAKENYFLMFSCLIKKNLGCAWF